MVGGAHHLMVGQSSRPLMRTRIWQQSLTRSRKRLFSGKVEGAAVWSAVLRQMLESRLSPWQCAIIAGDLSTSMVQKRDNAEEVAAAATLTRSYAAFLLPLIDRETAEGSTLVALIIVRKDLMKDGVALHRYMTSRGKAETTMQVTQAFDEIAKVKLSFGGTNLDHEASVVKIMGIWERIHPDRRGGPTRLQELIIAAMLHECKDARLLIETQLEMQMHTMGYYPNAITLLKILSPIIHARYKEQAQTHVIETPRPKREKAPGGDTFVCANCLGAHASNRCSFKCPTCAMSCCGAAIAGRTCAVAETEFPSKVLDAKGKSIPQFLYVKLKSKHESRVGGRPAAQSAPAIAPAPAATQAHMTARAEEAMFDSFDAARLGGVSAFTFTIIAPQREFDVWGGGVAQGVTPTLEASNLNPTEDTPE